MKKYLVIICLSLLLPIQSISAGVLDGGVGALGIPDGVDFECEALGNCDLGDVGDVSITSPSNNEVLTYDNGDWVNAVASGGGINFTKVVYVDPAYDADVTGEKYIDPQDAFDWVEAQEPDEENSYAIIFAPGKYIGNYVVENSDYTTLSSGGSLAISQVIFEADADDEPALIVRDSDPIAVNGIGIFTHEDGTAPALLIESTNGSATAFSGGFLSAVTQSSQAGAPSIRISVTGSGYVSFSAQECFIYNLASEPNRGIDVTSTRAHLNLSYTDFYNLEYAGASGDDAIYLPGGSDILDHSIRNCTFTQWTDKAIDGEGDIDDWVGNSVWNSEDIIEAHQAMFGEDIHAGNVGDEVFGNLTIKGHIYGEYLRYQDGFDFTAYAQAYDLTSLAVGAGTNDITTTPSKVTLTTDTNANDQEGTQSIAAVISRDQNPRLEGVVDLDSIDNCEFWFGFNTQSDGGHTSADEFALIGFDDSVSNNWQLYVCDGLGVIETIDSGTAASVWPTKMEIMISGIDNDGKVYWKIEDEAQTSNSSIYMTSDPHYIQFFGVTETTASKVFEIDYIEYEVRK